MKFEHLKDNLGHILDEHLNRTNLINRSIVFPESDENGFCHYDNEPLSNLLAEVKEDKNFMSMESLERVYEIKEALVKISQKVCNSIQEKNLEPPLFIEYQNLSNEFIARLLRFETDLTKEGNGIDPLTGLRSHNVVIEDLNRELSACARRGDYLGIAVGCIDSFADIRKNLTKEEKEDIIVFVSKVLKKTMRLYDDGYRYKDDMFILCFKQTDHLGAISAIERFVRFINEEHNSPEGERISKIAGKDITLSYSVAKLEVGANIETFLKDLEADVRENADEDSTILEYEDESDLEKYIKNIND